MAEIEKFEQVERRRIDSVMSQWFWADYGDEDAVKASDYDALLSLARKQAEELAKMPKWIAVEQELPRRQNKPLDHASVLVLGWKSGTRVHPMYYNFAGQAWHLDKDDLEVNPTRWMPLPAPPGSEAK